MSTRRVPVLCSVLVLVLLAAPSAGAQDDGAVAIVLDQQRPWTTPEDPTVTLEFQASNDGGEPLENLSLGVTVYSQVTSRTNYEQSLSADPAGTIVDTDAKPFDGALASGQTRSFAMSFDMVSLGISTTQSYVYPVRIELLAGSVPVATVRSAVVHVVERDPLFPVALNWRVVVHHPLLTGPGGVFRDESLERAVGPQGWIGSAATALRESAESKRPLAADLVLSPVLLLQLENMEDGYSVADGDSVRRVPAGQGGAADARKVLDDLRVVVSGERTELSSWTFAGATLPSLFDAFSRDFDVQMERGRAAVERILGVRPPTTVVYPRGSAVNEDVLERLETGGTEVLLLDPEAAPPPLQELGFAAPPVARLPSVRDIRGEPPPEPGEDVVAETGGFAAVVPDPGVQALLSSETASSDPVLAAQQAFAELATVWLEAPGQQDPPRGLAISVPERPAPRLVPALIRRLKGAPFLRPTTATELVQTTPLPVETASLVELDDGTFSDGYVGSIKQTRRRADAYRAMTEPSPTPLDEALETRLLLAEGKEFLDDESAGAELIGSVNRRLDEAFGRVFTTPGPPVTLTSLDGTIPIQVTNDTGSPVRVLLELDSDHLDVAGGSARELTLREPQQTLEFDVHLQTTGEFPVTVLLRAPTGRPLSEITIAVRSTAYNRIALVTTIGAALALLVLWARRFLSSRRTT